MFIKRLVVILTSLMITFFMYPQTHEKVISATENGVVYTKLLHSNRTEKDIKSSDEEKINIVFTMDDGWKSQYTEAYKILDKYGFRGSIGIIPSRVGQENFMTYKEISDLYIKGWSIVNHSYNHLSSHNSVDEEVEDIELTKKWMNSKQLKTGSDIYIAPYGSINKDSISELKDIGYKSIRTLKELIIFGENSDNRESKIINLTTDRKSQDVITDINDCIDEGKDIIFVSHKFGEENDGTGMYYKASEFENVVKFIKSKEDHLEVKTYIEYVDQK